MKEELLKKATREMDARGGKRRAETLTPERLAQIGRKAGIQSGKARRKRATAKRRMDVAA